MSPPGPAPHPCGVPPIAASQAGAFTARQAVSAGRTPRQVQRRSTAGRWVTVAGRGLAETGRPLTAHSLAWSAQLTWPDATASHLTAAQIHGFAVRPDPLAHVIALQRHAGMAGIRNHRQPLAADDVRILGGLAITSRRRTAVDCLSWLGLDDALDLWAWLSSRQLITRSCLAGAIADRAGWRGTPQLLTLLRLVRRGAASRGELELHRLLDAAGIRGWVAGARVSDRAGVIAVVDVLFPRQRVVVEVDGWRSHGSREAFELDRSRQNRLAAAGYVTLRVTWAQLTRQPHIVVRDLREVLASH
jgi:hypothetical protein